MEHRIGGLEKQDLTGNISYDPENHEKMVGLRAAKVEKIADFIPLQTADSGADAGHVCILGWGSTYGAIRTAVKDLMDEGMQVSHIHLRHLFPFPRNLGDLLRGFTHVLVPELNNGQLVKLIRSEFLIDAKSITKIQGMPFSSSEIRDAVTPYLQS